MTHAGRASTSRIYRELIADAAPPSVRPARWWRRLRRAAPTRPSGRRASLVHCAAMTIALIVIVVVVVLLRHLR